MCCDAELEGGRADGEKKRVDGCECLCEKKVKKVRVRVVLRCWVSLQQTRDMVSLKWVECCLGDNTILTVGQWHFFVFFLPINFLSFEPYETFIDYLLSIFWLCCSLLALAHRYNQSHCFHCFFSSQISPSQSANLPHHLFLICNITTPPPYQCPYYAIVYSQHLPPTLPTLWVRRTVNLIPHSKSICPNHPHCQIPQLTPLIAQAFSRVNINKLFCSAFWDLHVDRTFL